MPCLSSYFLLRIKEALRLAGCALACLVIAAFFVFGAVNLIDRFAADLPDNRLRVAVALPEMEGEYEYLFGLANSMKSLKEFAVFEYCTEDEAMAGFEEGRFDMAAVLPDDFYEKAKAMQDTRFDLYYHENPGYGEKKLIALLGSVEQLMLLTENSIRALYLGTETGLSDFSREDVENDILKEYVGEYLERDRYFDERFVSAYGSYSFYEYIAVSGFLIFILLFSFVFFTLYDDGSLEFERYFGTDPAAVIGFYLIRIAVIAVLLIGIFMLAVFGADRLCEYKASYFIMMKSSGYIKLILPAISIALFVNAAGYLTVRVKGARLLYFLFVMLLVLVSGGIIPRGSFPEALQFFVGLSPFCGWHEALLGAVFGNPDGGQWINLVVWDGIFLVVPFVYHFGKSRV